MLYFFLNKHQINTKKQTETAFPSGRQKKKNPETIAVSGFFAGADCETRTRDLLITKANSRVCYRSIVLNEMLIYQGYMRINVP